MSTKPLQAGHPRRVLPGREQHDRVERPARRGARSSSTRSSTSRRRPSAASSTSSSSPRACGCASSGGRIHDLDIVGRPDTLTVLTALAAVTDAPRPGRHAQRHVPRALRAGPPAGHARPPVGRPRRRGTSSRRRTRSPARTSAAAASSTTPTATSGPASSSATARELWDSWADDELVADPATRAVRAQRVARRVRPPRPAVRHPRATSTCPRSPQRHPVILQAGDSDGGRELAAATADAIFSRHSTLADRRRRSTPTPRVGWPGTGATATT